MHTISIAHDFSTTPGGRSKDDGPNNGAAFREKFLVGVVREKTPVVIDLDGVAGLPGSFCDEAFAAIVRTYNLSRAEFDSLFRFEGRGEDFKINKKMIDLNVDRAIRERANN